MYTLVARSMHASLPGKEGAERENGAEQSMGMFELRGNDRNGMEPGGRGKARKYRIKWLQYDRTLSEYFSLTAWALGLRKVR